MNTERWTLRLVVTGGLVGAAVAAATVEPPPRLPGVALGSTELLILERTVALFAGWMVLAVVVIEAWRGRLPLEISGRGVRYADVPAAEAMARATDGAVEQLWTELDAQRIDIANMQGRFEEWERR